ncbi:MAG TPA: OsmC family protein [Burkholderiales bacterium]|jgi:uncharacterized OsmC-like protein
MSLDVNFVQIKESITRAAEGVRDGRKEPVRKPRVKLKVVKNLQGETTAGKFVFRGDAAIDAGGAAEYARPMDYLLGGLAHCQQMWCLRWAALEGVTLSQLEIETESVFNWRGEYLGEMYSGMLELHVYMKVAGDGMTAAQVCEMADMTALRCPVYATLRRATLVKEYLQIGDGTVIEREWHRDEDVARLVKGA